MDDVGQTIQWSKGKGQTQNENKQTMIHKTLHRKQTTRTKFLLRFI